MIGLFSYLVNEKKTPTLCMILMGRYQARRPMRLHPSPAPRPTAVTSDQHRKPVEHRLKFVEVGAPAQLTGPASVEKAGRAAEHRQVLRRFAGPATRGEQPVLALAEQALDMFLALVVELAARAALGQHAPVDMGASETGAGHGHGIERCVIAAGPMFLAGGKVKGGIYGAYPSLTDLDSGDLKYTTDFRRVYATLLDKWLNTSSVDVLKNKFESMDLL